MLIRVFFVSAIVLIEDGKNLPPLRSAPKQWRHCNPGYPWVSPLRFPCLSDSLKPQGQNCASTANKFFYKQIGLDHYWRDRLLWSDKEWIKYVTNKKLETHVLKKGEDLVGYYEQEYHPVSNEVELINMGVLKEFRGLKLGSILVSHAIASASRKNPERMWVHTCSLDHKYALQNYKSKGFEIFKEEEIDFVA